MLIVGTPSTCTNIGLHHVSGEANFDLVISGPNFGRNSSTAFTLSSGTVGAAMEAALVGGKDLASQLTIVWVQSNFSVVCHLLQKLDRERG